MQVANAPCPGSTTADVVGDISTLGLSSIGERGLLGIAFDPQYATNKFVYLYYTSTVPNTHNRISRFTVNDTDAADFFFAGTNTSGDAGSTGTPTAQLIFDLDALSGATNHNGGAIHFGPDGKLYVAVGDNANGSRAQNRSDPFGKILRFNADGSIPSDNPFCTTAGNLSCAVWALGLRNPFSFAFEPGTGRMHINDVGELTWEEINLGAARANYGWPASEGPDNTAGFTAPIFSYGHTDASPPGSGPGGFFTGIAWIVAVVMDYVKVDDTKGTWLESHFAWQIKTFWVSLAGSILGWLTVWILIGWLLLFAIGVWAIYRIVKGWLALNDRAPLPDSLI